MNKFEYMKTMNNIICDNTKFKKVDKDIFKLNISLADKVTRFLRCLKNMDEIDLYIFNILTPSGSNVWFA